MMTLLRKPEVSRESRRHAFSRSDEIRMRSLERVVIEA
jgi:hypothetical protein